LFSTIADGTKTAGGRRAGSRGGAVAAVSLTETVDLGWDRPDVHPPDKRPLAERIGKAAQSRP
jgi:hypothetical protein